MSYKYNPDDLNEKLYLKEEGKFEFTVKSNEFTFTNTGILIAKLVLERNADGATTSAKLFGKPEKSGNWTRLNQFIGSTSTKREIEDLLARGEFDITDDFIKKMCDKSIGRQVVGEVRKEEYVKRDGTAGVSYGVTFFRPHPQGPISDNPLG